VAEPPPGPTAKGPIYGAITKGAGTAVPLEVLSSPATWPLMEEEAGTVRNPPKGEDYTGTPPDADADHADLLLTRHARPS